MFSQASVILFTGGICGKHPLGRHHHCRHPLGRHPPGQTPLGRHPLLGRHPPGQTPAPRWLLQQTVRILLECLLVSNEIYCWLVKSQLFHLFLVRGDFLGCDGETIRILCKLGCKWQQSDWLWTINTGTSKDFYKCDSIQSF